MSPKKQTDFITLLNYGLPFPMKWLYIPLISIFIWFSASICIGEPSLWHWLDHKTSFCQWNEIVQFPMRSLDIHGSIITSFPLSFCPAESIEWVPPTQLRDFSTGNDGQDLDNNKVLKVKILKISLVAQSISQFHLLQLGNEK